MLSIFAPPHETNFLNEVLCVWKFLSGKSNYQKMFITFLPQNQPILLASLHKHKKPLVGTQILCGNETSCYTPSSLHTI